LDVHVEFLKEETMRNLLIAAALGVGLLSTGAVTPIRLRPRPSMPAGSRPVRASRQVQYYGRLLPPPVLRAAAAALLRAGPPRYYGYYAPPRPRYYGNRGPTTAAGSR
jgi:hypothetical protein